MEAVFGRNELQPDVRLESIQAEKLAITEIAVDRVELDVEKWTDRYWKPFVKKWVNLPSSLAAKIAAP
jgi:hypothetical protein